MPAPVSSTLFILLSALVAIGLPAVLYILLRRKTGVRITPLLTGALAYYLAVFVLESTAAVLLMQNEAIRGYVTGSATVYAVYGGLLAGIFEETARLTAFRLLARKHTGMETALAYGLGHGGFESIVLVGAGMLMNLWYAYHINTLGLEAALDAFPHAETALLALVNASPVSFLAAGAERISVLAFHLAASVLVWLAATKKGSIFLYPLAVCLHLLFSFPAGVYQYGGIQHVWLLELVSLILSAAVCFLAYRIWLTCRNKAVLPPEEPPSSPAEQPQ